MNWEGDGVRIFGVGDAGLGEGAFDGVNVGNGVGVSGNGEGICGAGVTSGEIVWSIELYGVGVLICVGDVLIMFLWTCLFRLHAVNIIGNKKIIAHFFNELLTILSPFYEIITLS